MSSGVRAPTALLAVPLTLVLFATGLAATALSGGGYAPVIESAPLLLFGLVGGLIARRRPEHRIGWLLCAVGSTSTG